MRRPARIRATLRLATLRLAALLAVPLLVPGTVQAQQGQEGEAARDVPSVATVIRLRDVTIALGEVELRVLLTPDQVSRLTAVLDGTGAEMRTRESGSEGAEPSRGE